MAVLYILIFIASCVILAFSGNILIKSLSKIAQFLGWREFIASFFIMSIGTSLPEFLVGINAALQGIPELSFGNIIGQNIIHFTLAIAICVLLLGELPIQSRVIQTSIWFTGILALLPILLILDKNLSRIDGLILICAFFVYTLWIFSKRSYFEKTYEIPNGPIPSPSEKLKIFIKNIVNLITAFLLLLIGSVGIVQSASFFAEALSIPLVIIGVLIVSIGTALPETYFSIFSASKNEPYLSVGNLLGSTVISATLVLGSVALISPIQVIDTSSYINGRLFLIISAALFVFFFKTGRKITKKEAYILLVIYLLFVSIELIKI